MLIGASMALALMAQGAPVIEDLSWLSGYWLSCGDGREISEAWSDPRGGLMAGHGVMSAPGRVSFELMHIGPHEDGLAYFAQPGGRAPTVFPLVEVQGQAATFANPGHDFPQRILYRLEGDRLTARLEAERDGRTQGMEWTYRKAELNARCPG